jgi:hypothetical protein
MHFLTLYLDFAPQVLMAVALGAFLWRGRRQEYPFFFGYMLFYVVYALATIAAYFYALSDPEHLSQNYQWVVTSGVAIGALFEFGVLYELSDHLILSHMKTSSGLRRFLRWTAAVLVLAGSLTSALLARNDLNAVTTAFQTLDSAVNLAKLGFLLALILLTRVLDISWRQVSAGITVGFGLAAAGELAGTALMSLTTHVSYPTVDLVRMAAFHGCVVVWIVYIVRGEEARVSETTAVQVSDLEGHLEELQRMVQR